MEHRWRLNRSQGCALSGQRVERWQASRVGREARDERGNARPGRRQSIMRSSVANLASLSCFDPLDSSVLCRVSACPAEVAEIAWNHLGLPIDGRSMSGKSWTWSVGVKLSAGLELDLAGEGSLCELRARDGGVGRPSRVVSSYWQLSGDQRRSPSRLTCARTSPSRGRPKQGGSRIVTRHCDCRATSGLGAYALVAALLTGAARRRRAHAARGLRSLIACVGPFVPAVVRANRGVMLAGDTTDQSDSRVVL